LQGVRLGVEASTHLHLTARFSIVQLSDLTALAVSIKNFAIHTALPFFLPSDDEKFLLQ
jgi:hypothetical protein